MKWAGGDYESRSIIEFLNEREPCERVTPGPIFEPTLVRCGRWTGRTYGCGWMDSDGNDREAYETVWTRHPSVEAAKQAIRDRTA